MGIVEKVNGIFENVMRENQEWCTDHLLEIINEILHMASEIMKKYHDKTPDEVQQQADDEEEQEEREAPQIVFDSFLVNFEYFIILLGASDVTITEKAAQNIIAFIHFSMIQGIVRNKKLVIRDDQLQHILPAFKTEKTIVCKSLIKSIYWALSLNENALKPSVENTKKVQKIAEKLMGSDNKSLTNTAREVTKLCKSVLN